MDVSVAIYNILVMNQFILKFPTRGIIWEVEIINLLFYYFLKNFITNHNPQYFDYRQHDFYFELSTKWVEWEQW